MANNNNITVLTGDSTDQDYKSATASPVGSKVPLDTGCVALAGQMDDTTTADTIYIGKAAPGTATSAALWQIHRHNTASGIVTTWADSNGKYDNIWDNRASLVYG